MRNIPLKNYFIFGCISVITIILILYAGSWYKATNEYNKRPSPVLEVINTIQLDELDSYLLENPFALIYMSNYDESLYTYEEELSDIITKYDLYQDIVYISLNKVNTKKLRKYYNTQNYSENNLVIFEKGKIKYFLAVNDAQLTRENTLEFLIEHEMID